MSSVKSNGINRLRDRLVMIKFKEALVWNDEDFQEVIYSKSSSWYHLLKWLLEQLSDQSICSDSEAMRSGIKETAVGLGICNSKQATHHIWGDATPEERIKFLSKLIRLVENLHSYELYLESNTEDNTKKIDKILTTLTEVMGPSNVLNGKQSPATIKNRSTSRLPQNLRRVDSYVEDYSICQEMVTKAKENMEKMRKELELGDDVTASDAIKHCKMEREDLLDKLSTLNDSLKPLAKEVKNIFETELSDFLPVEVADPIDLPEIDSLFEKVDCILQVQSNDKAVENFVTSLRSKMYNESPRENWSTKKSSSLPLLQLYEESQYVLKK